MPAEDDPDTVMPGVSLGGNDGLSRRFLTVYQLPEKVTGSSPARRRLTMDVNSTRRS